MYNAVLENGCSELGARMSAMDSSSRNAGEMLDRLTLTYNRYSVPPIFFLQIFNMHGHINLSTSITERISIKQDV